MKTPPKGTKRVMKSKKPVKAKPPAKLKKEKKTGPSMIQRAMAAPPADDDVGDHEYR